MFSLQQEKPNDTLLPLYIFLNAMHLNLNAKGQFWLIWATDFSPTLLCFSIRTFQNFSQTVCLVHAQKKRTTTQFVIWQAINIKFGNEKNDEKEYQFPGSHKLWQKPQATYWKQWTSQSSLRLNNLKTVLKLLQDPAFQMEYLYQ